MCLQVQLTIEQQAHLDVTSTKVNQPMISQRSRSASHTMKKLTPSTFFFLYNKHFILKNMCNFKGCRRLCSYIMLYLNTRKLPKIAKVGHGRCMIVYVVIVLTYVLRSVEESAYLSFKQTSDVFCFICALYYGHYSGANICKLFTVW